MRIVCNACKISPQRDRKFCHECRGLGYIERFEIPKNCTTSLPECPVSYDPMVNGWECSRCGRSGPCEENLLAAALH